MMKKNYWNNIYKTKKHESIWPWNDVIKLCKRFCNKKKNQKILELGCGLGANIPFFIKEKFKYHGIDHSKIAVNKIKKNFPTIKNDIIHADITNFNFKNFENKFDVILDRGTLTHLNNKEFRLVTNKIQKLMLPSSIFICCSLYSHKCTDHVNNKNQNIFDKGLFAKVGYINFFNKKKIKNLYKKWTINFLEEVDYFDHIKNYRYSYWNLILKKHKLWKKK